MEWPKFSGTQFAPDKRYGVKNPDELIEGRTYYKISEKSFKVEKFIVVKKIEGERYFLAIREEHHQDKKEPAKLFYSDCGLLPVVKTKKGLVGWNKSNYTVRDWPYH